jgi:hypothetical protein
LVLLALTAGAGVAFAKGKKPKQVKFVSVHPIPEAHGGGLCHIEAEHFHAYAPTNVKVEYRTHDDHHYFVGDPVAYGWDGPKHSYYGHHPVHVSAVVGDPGDHVEYCYLDGAHYHYYEPHGEVGFELHAGAYWYVGEPAPAYVEARATLDPIDVVYEPIVYERPVVVYDAPPPAWIGLVVVAPAVEVHAPKVKHGRGRGHAHGHGHVGVGVGVEVVVPSVSVEIGVGGHHHHHGHHKHKRKHRGKGKHKRGRW